MKKLVLGALALAAVTVAAGSASAAPKLTNVTIQLKWVPQAQFAGYYAALDLGYYKAAGLNVTLKNGGPDIIPEQVVASGQAQFGLDWLPSLLAARDKGTQLVNVAQVFARSGMTQLTWKNSGITTIAGMKGKKVANWLGGNQYELFAALTKAGMNPAKNQGVTIVQQPFDMNLFLKHQVDSASAMTYNELAQVLETGVKPSQINVIKMQDVGTGMLEDGIFSTASWLKSPANQAIAVKVIAASLQGWIYCRDHQAACVGYTLKAGPTLPKGHQTWMMNEINVIKMQDAGTGMLEDGMFSTASWLKSPANQAIAVKVINASLAGWIYCRDHQAACVQYTLKAGPTLPKGHQTWMMNEINKLIWPNASGIGIMNTADFNRTASIAKQFGVIKKAPSGAYRTDLAEKAVAELKAKGLDVNGKSWKPLNVKVTPGGK